MADNTCSQCKWHKDKRCFLKPPTIVCPSSLNSLDYKRPYVEADDFCKEFELKY